MKRRKFSILAALAVAGILTPISSCRNNPANTAGRLQRPDTLSKILTSDDIGKLGKMFIEKNPSEKSQEILSNHILRNRVFNEGNTKLDLYLKDLVRTDFENGNIVVLDGWIISITEARQCALNYINQ